MSPELQAKLENLVFSVPNPYLPLDNRLQPYLDLVAEIERETIERCAHIADQHAETFSARYAVDEETADYLTGAESSAHAIAGLIRSSD